MSEITASGLSAPEVLALVPQPSLLVPAAEVTGGGIGTNTGMFSQEGHSHPRLTSTTLATLAADGTAAVSFTRSFTNKPGVVMTEIDAASTQPLVMVVQSYVQTAGLFTGCIIKGYRSQALPSQNQLSLATLLTGVIAGINAIASTLTGYNIFGGTAAGASVSVIAVARSDV